MASSRNRPWLKNYTAPAATVSPAHATALDMAISALTAAGSDPLLYYFDTPVSGVSIAESSDALAHALQEMGVERGDRVAIQLQSIPQFVIGLVAVWKVAGIAVLASPMLRAPELNLMLHDSGACALITLESLFEDTGRAAAQGTGVKIVITTSPLDLLEGPTPSALADVHRFRPAETHDLLKLVEAYRGKRPGGVELAPDDIAVLIYTSGTTGPSKGAMNLHRNVVFTSTVFRDWVGLTSQDTIMGIAPLFHVTGLILHVGLSMVSHAPLVLTYRFIPAETLRLIEQSRATFTVAAITAFTAMLNDPAFSSTDLSSLRTVYTGGAPTPPTIVEAWRKETGVYVHNAYGLTESTAPTHATPLGAEAPVDPRSGALSIGVPVFDTRAEILADDGQSLPPGEIGELVISGPGVVPGYWQRPEETAIAIVDGRLRTGDVGFADEDGWFYLVDRRKDLIIASGYKIWPRDVEDVLYQHPAVREAAVIGVPDEYRGETVSAFVSLKPGQAAVVDELISFCRERLSAYKSPRNLTILDELPKTPTGKILRRELRAAYGEMG